MPEIITIPKPCHEDWNAMSPREQGRHCTQCSKTVVDFTAMQPQEILMYMREQGEQRVCGRFNQEQLDVPIPTPEDFVKQLHYFSIPFLKKAAAIFLFAFSVMAVSCNDHEQTVGKIAVANVDSPPQRTTGDTIIMQPLLGEPAIDPIQKREAKKPCIKTVEGTVKGEVAMIPPTMGIVSVEPVKPVIDSTPRNVLMGDVEIAVDSAVKK